MAPCSPCVRLWYKFGSRPNQNQIFVIFVVLRRSVGRIAGPISAAQRLGYTAPKKRRSGGEPLATLSRFDRARI